MRPRPGNRLRSSLPARALVCQLLFRVVFLFWLVWDRHVTIVISHAVKELRMVQNGETIRKVNEKSAPDRSAPNASICS